MLDTVGGPHCPSRHGRPRETHALCDGACRGHPVLPRRPCRSAGWAILDFDGSVLGFACAPHLSKATGDVELGDIVNPIARGRGVATWVLPELTGWAFGWGAERVDTTVWSRLPSDPKVVEDEGAGAYVQG